VSALPDVPGLSDRDRAVLSFERTWWTEPGPKDDGIRQRLGLEPDEYAVRLAALVDHPGALAEDPLLVKRLRRQRERRRRRR
jgi:hypothetical protein